MDVKTLPIYAVIPNVAEAVRQGRNVVLIAPPGSGKTTQVPKALLELRSCEGAIVVVQPRRLACTTVATRVAEEMGVSIGNEVGYIVRYDGQASSKTRLLFVTDGVLLRLMEKDPSLSWASIVVFDEFHERRANVDLALGLLKQVQARRRDLRLVVMSATMQSERVAKYLNAVSFKAEGRTYPVEIEYDDRVRDDDEALEAVPRWVAKLQNRGEEGDILVFLPGKEEIRHATHAIESLHMKDLTVLPLHGELPPDEQQNAFLPLEGRKVILATNVAETSVTVPGVRFVIDTGFERRSEFDADLRISHLNLGRVSQTSADQRAGRAGREGPGKCVRLWKSNLQKMLSRQAPVEMENSDLASVVLTLRSLGIKSVESFDLLTRPDPEKIQAAELLLTHIGALNGDGELTPVGWRMLRLPLPPRYARMVVEGESNGCLNEMATIAAFMSGRPLFVEKRGAKQTVRERHARHTASDFFTLLELHHASQVRDEQLDGWCKENGVRVEALVEANRLRRKVIAIATERGSFFNRRPAHLDVVCKCILTGLVDMVAMRTQGNTYRLANGMTCTKDDASVVSANIVVAGSVRARRNTTDGSGIIGFLTHVEAATLQRATEHLTHVVRLPITFNQADGSLTVREEVRYQELVLRAKESQVDAHEAEAVLAEQRVRAQNANWQRVDIQPGIGRRGYVIWRGVRVEVPADQAGPHWASVEEGSRTVIVPRERIAAVLVAKTEISGKVTHTSNLPANLQARLARLSPAVGKLLGK
jgi:ATP-dependent helicase HrpB